MMLAMSWMYAVMNGNLLPGQGGTARGTDGATSPHPSMPGTDMPGMDMSDTSSAGGDNPACIDAINWLGTIGFAIASLWWLYRYFTLRKAEPAHPWDRFLGAARQAMMAAAWASCSQ